VRDCSNSFGVSMPCAATTITFPVARSSLPSARVTSSEVIRPSAPTSRRVTTASATTCTPRRSALMTCAIASYFACTGQIGMQLPLPQHAGRSSYGAELRACGVACTEYRVDTSAAAVR
jgi:hypothetical protein